jgi:hypothetical protein
MKRYSGVLMGLTAVLHTLVGMVIYWEPILDIARSGFVHSVDPHFDRGAAFWFLFTGFLFFLIAQWMNWFIKENRPIPKFVGWHLLFLSSLGVLLMPLSGFWLIIPQAMIILRA